MDKKRILLVLDGHTADRIDCLLKSRNEVNKRNQWITHAIEEKLKAENSSCKASGDPIDFYKLGRATYSKIYTDFGGDDFAFSKFIGKLLKEKFGRKEKP